MSEREPKDYEDVLRAVLSLTMGRDMTRPPAQVDPETSHPKGVQRDDETTHHVKQDESEGDEP